MFRFNLRNKIILFTMVPFSIVMSIMSTITVQNKIDTEKELLMSRLNNYAMLLESGALSLESITQKDKLELSFEEDVVLAEIIKEDYTTPYSTKPAAGSTSLSKSQVDRVFKEHNSIFYITKGETQDYLYPIAYRGVIVGIFHVRLLSNNIKDRIKEYLYFIVALNVFALFVSFFLIVILVKNGILKQLSELMKGSRELTRGNLEYSLDIRSNDEVGDLGHSFNEMTKNLRDTIASRDLLIDEVKERNILLSDSEQKVRNANLELEARVQQRTAELAVAKEKAEAANLAKSVFLANMSHELRTPLNAILGFSSLMQNVAQTPENQTHNLDIINRSGEHLLHLLNDILDMAKIEAGQVQLENLPFDLGAMLRDVTDMMRVRAENKALQLQIDQTSHFPRYIVGDEARHRQILINLLGNAIKYTDQGGVSLRLDTQINEKTHLLIEVEDTGTGIPPEQQQHIFDPFVQLTEQGATKGTGLGLTITRQFVQMMDGEISLQSEPGKGSLFRVLLPLCEAKKSDIVKLSSPEAGKVIGLASGQPEYRILIVEDQYENQLLLARLMESVGFRVKTADTGPRGIELFQSWHPHLIWMDQRMPGMDGTEATRRIRQLADGKAVRIVAVTASAFDEQRSEMLTAGMNDYVRKPYRATEIYDCLSKHLGVKYLYEGAPEPEEEDLLLTPEMLNELPDELVVELQRALESLETERIGEVIQQIGEQDQELQKKLSSLAGNYNYPAILKVLQMRGVQD